MSQQIRIDDHLYERIKSEKRDDETFSDAIERLIETRSFRDLRDVFDDEQVSGMRAAVESADEADHEAVREVADRFE